MPAFLLGMAGLHIKIAGAIYLDRVVSATLIGYIDLVPPLQSTQLDGEYASHYDRWAYKIELSARSENALRSSI